MSVGVCSGHSRKGGRMLAPIQPWFVLEQQKTLSSLRTVPIGGFITLGPPVSPHATSTGTGRARGELRGRREEALGLRLVLCETASTEAGRRRNTCFTAGRCGVRLDVCCLTEGRSRRLDDGGASRRLLSERTLTERGLPGGSNRR